MKKKPIYKIEEKDNNFLGWMAASQSMIHLNDDRTAKTPAGEFKNVGNILDRDDLQH